MPQKQPQDITYTFTNDKHRISQYLSLRKDLYCNDETFKGFRHFNYLEEEDYIHPNAQMLLMFAQNRCIGGACLTISTPEKRVLLPLEEDLASPVAGTSFLPRTFPHLNLDDKRYCEFNRVVVHPDYRDGRCTINMFYELVRKAKQQSIQYLFGMGDAVRIRLYTKICVTEFGMEMTYFSKLKLPIKDDYEGIRMYIMMGDLKTASETERRLEP